ncbi:N-acetylmuramoyl-L-alanine amidase [Paenibacillus typhae]|uniref:N-acetylmuramoyl-L-alanine amidase n=1 Tax=Paenibacillus typhae TaxID=1174501 RepID=UPI001C8E0D21|nr:N-acetylmuramoyl-L-alanine amidase [Paenibacillus typhae]MBY0011513.1 N-acetylmuramoyl-L-alanine amidase [Paenibacillus typhae]
MQIIQKGNQHTNSSSRDGHVPLAIVNHISGGTMGSMDAWFTSKDNLQSSAHFGISKSGIIHQYLPIERMAWANGLTAANIKKATAVIIQEEAPTNPNKYTVSIEHEGIDGALTEPQFTASVWLHKYIAAEVKRIYGKELLLDTKHVIGHFQVDPVRKPYCPGPKFPWERLYAALKTKEDEDVKVDKAATVVNGNRLADEGVLIEGRVYVPLAAVGKALGAAVDWNNITKTATLTTKEVK